MARIERYKDVDDVYFQQFPDRVFFLGDVKLFNILLLMAFLPVYN